jgi:hypothetical protein
MSPYFSAATDQARELQVDETEWNAAESAVVDRFDHRSPVNRTRGGEPA